MRTARFTALLAMMLPLACGEEEVGCIQTYDRCPGANPCEPICVFEDEAPTCEDQSCSQPFEAEGECQLFANECVFR